MIEKTGFAKNFAKQHPILLAWIVCALAIAFYLYEFALQVAPSVMTAQLTSTLQVNSATLGIIIGIYYYAYAPMQLPAGLLYDRFGPRILLSAAILVCAMGTFLFSLTTSIPIAISGRLLMGLGSAFAYTGALLLIARWFPPLYFAILVGIVQLVGATGAISGQVIMAEAIERWGWRSSIQVMVMLGVILAIFTWLIIRDYPPHQLWVQKRKTLKSKLTELKRLKLVCGNKQSWLIATYSFMVWAPIAAFAALWGVPFLVKAYQINTEAAAFLMAFIWVGAGLGSPILGALAEAFKIRHTLLTVGAVIGIFSLLIILYIPHLPYFVLTICMFCLGFAGATQSLAYAFIKENTDSRATATAIGFNNMAVVLGGAVMQPLVGLLISWSWTGAIKNNLPFYNINDYYIALSILPLCYLIAAIINIWFLHETIN